MRWFRDNPSLYNCMLSLLSSFPRCWCVWYVLSSIMITLMCKRMLLLSFQFLCILCTCHTVLILPLDVDDRRWSDIVPLLYKDVTRQMCLYDWLNKRIVYCRIQNAIESFKDHDVYIFPLLLLQTISGPLLGMNITSHWTTAERHFAIVVYKICFSRNKYAIQIRSQIKTEYQEDRVVSGMMLPKQANIRTL